MQKHRKPVVRSTIICFCNTISSTKCSFCQQYAAIVFKILTFEFVDFLELFFMLVIFFVRCINTFHDIIDHILIIQANRPHYINFISNCKLLMNVKHLASKLLWHALLHFSWIFNPF